MDLERDAYKQIEAIVSDSLLFQEGKNTRWSMLNTA